MLTVTSNKVQLLQLIVDQLPLRIRKFQLEQENSNKFMLTGANPIPIQVHLGVIVEKRYMEILHEEADLVIANQTVHLMTSEGKECVHVLCEDM